MDSGTLGAWSARFVHSMQVRWKCCSVCKCDGTCAVCVQKRDDDVDEGFTDMKTNLGEGQFLRMRLIKFHPLNAEVNPLFILSDSIGGPMSSSNVQTTGQDFIFPAV